jgi:pimeloyl-ACP methyl ester carboxylesterase
MPHRTSRDVLYTFITTTVLFLASSAAPAASRTYTVTAPDGVKLTVEESGSPQGPTIVFIHGLLGSRLDWDAQVKSAKLQRYRMVAYDLRGHGLSDKPTEPDAYRDGRHWADDLAAIIEQSKVNNPVLVGWSLGGAVISNYLATYGDSHIAGAVYVDGVIELKPDQIVDHPEVYRDLVSPDLRTHLDAERTFLALCFHKPPDSSTFERLLSNGAMASWVMQSTVQSMTVAASEGLSEVRKPVLLIYGAQDALVKTKPTIARATALDPRLQSKVYASSGHAPFLEEPDRFNRDLSDFIEASLRP